MIVGFYITGHGFGHATRSIEIARGLLRAGHSVCIVTNVPPTFFDELRTPSQQEEEGEGEGVDGEDGLEPQGCLQIHQRRLDSGAIQPDALRVDPGLTLDEYMSSVFDKHDELVASEVQFLKFIEADIVLADATPLACSAARIAGVKSVLLSNFSWHYMYKYMAQALGAEAEARYADMLEQVAGDYASASTMFSYPGDIAWAEAHPNIPVRRLPLVSRRARRSRQEVRAALGIPQDVKMLLLGFGGHMAAWRLEEGFVPPGWYCCVLGMRPEEVPQCSRFRCLPHDSYVPDLVAASDCWLGKLGYGTISESISHNVPLLYVPRSHWPEEPCLEVYLKQCNGGVKMPAEDFLSGNWRPYIEAAVESKESGAIVPCDPIFDDATLEVVNALEKFCEA